MSPADLGGLVLESVAAQRLRAVLTMLGIVVGMASVVLLSSIGEGTRAGVLDQFTQFGTTIIGVRPGKSKTLGVSPGAMGGTTHPLTVDDGLALRRVPGVRLVAPHVVGNAKVEAGERSRNTIVYGTVAEDEHILRWSPRAGAFLPPGDPDRVPPVCVLGARVARELFPDATPLGQHVRVGEARFRVVGVMPTKGQMLGFDLDDMVFVPVHRALKLFNQQQVTEVHLLAESAEAVPRVVAGIRSTLMDRHDGEEDFEATTQSDMLAVVDQVFTVLTTGVLVIAGISVLVGAMGILTILWVTVTERTAEIGLVKALGASDAQVRALFLAEAGLLSLTGGALGLALGAGAGWALAAAIPGFRVETPGWVAPLVLGVSLGVGLLAGVVPAVRAARLDPITALRHE